MYKNRGSVLSPAFVRTIQQECLWLRVQQLTGFKFIFNLYFHIMFLHRPLSLFGIIVGAVASSEC